MINLKSGRYFLLALGFFCLSFLIASPSQASTSTSTCATSSTFYLSLKNYSGQIATGLKYELYEQDKDAKGLPIAGKKIGGGTIGQSGQASIKFIPDKEEIYALKVWDKKSDKGEFWFYGAARFVCGYDRYLNKTLPALTVVMRDSKNALKRNYSFSVYAQRYDADGQPFYDNNDLVASLKTDGGGQSTFYVAPYNPYQSGLTGMYVISAKDANGNTSAVYNVQVPVDKDYTFQYVFSSLSGEIRDGRKKVQTNREVRLYEQYNYDGRLELGKQLKKFKTNANGAFSVDYPAGTYALAVLDDYGRENIFWNISVKGGSSNYRKLVVGTARITLTDSLGEGLDYTPSVKIYSLVTDGNLNYYRDKQVGTAKMTSAKVAYVSLTPGYYQAVYVGKNSREYAWYFRVKNGQLTSVPLAVSSRLKVTADQVFRIYY